MFAALYISFTILLGYHQLHREILTFSQRECPCRHQQAAYLQTSYIDGYIDVWSTLVELPIMCKL